MKQFEWTDELVHEYQVFQFDWYRKNLTEDNIKQDSHLSQKAMDAFKQSKQPKQEWEIVEVGGYWNDKDTSLGVYEKKIIDGKIAYYNDLFGGFDNMEYIFNSMRGIIYSVKRLSDGEVFSVGDAIEWKITEGIFSSTIQGFELEYLDMMVRVENNSRVNLCVIKKAKQPLFTTEDGVPVYDGCECFIVDMLLGWEIRNKKYENIEDVDKTQHRFYLHFSTRAAAETYVLANKAQLSLSDVEQAYVGDKKSKEYISLIDNLRLIIRQKK